MARIAIIGAGGVIFAQNFIKDILLDETLRSNTEVVLMDIDRERLEVALKFGEIISKKLNVEFNPVATTDLREALERVNVETPTPIEAMNVLYQLKQML